jgi:hypothetical protein
MTNTTVLALPLLAESTASKHVVANQQFQMLDRAHAWEITATQNAPPGGTPNEGDAYIVGSVPTGLFTGHAGAIATYFTGWIFTPPVTGIIIWHATDAEWQGYNETYGWHPLQDRDSGTEHWTGRFSGGTGSTNRVYAKVLTGTALPSSTSKNFAHSISSLDVDECWVKWAVGEDNGSFTFPLGVKDASVPELIGIDEVNATNVVVISNFNASAWNLRCRLEYRKT